MDPNRETIEKRTVVKTVVYTQNQKTTTTKPWLVKRI